MRLILMMLLASILSSGCINKAFFQPPPEPYESWSKPEATRLDIEKSMLECGMNVDGSGGGEPFDYNEYFLSELCMEAQGYSDSFWTVAEGCRQHPSLPACQPGAVIPKPSVERRLNSKYCQSARNMIDEDSYQRCMVNLAAKYERVTEKDCAYWHRDLVEECRP